MRDIYLMHKTTGELMPSSDVFKEFYKTHGILESVFDFWSETKFQVENSEIKTPDFQKVF